MFKRHYDKSFKDDIKYQWGGIHLPVSDEFLAEVGITPIWYGFGYRDRSLFMEHYYIYPLCWLVRAWKWYTEYVWFRGVCMALYMSAEKAGFNVRKIEAMRVSFWSLLQLAMMGEFFYRNADGEWIEINCVTNG